MATTLLWAGAAVARPWNGIEPGVSRREDVVKRFGEPSKTVNVENREVLAYFGPQALKGTSQTQFRVDPSTQLVERIDVFPGPQVDREAVENTYGPPCPANGTVTGPCYFKKLTDDFRTYHL